MPLPYLLYIKQKLTNIVNYERIFTKVGVGVVKIKKAPTNTGAYMCFSYNTKLFHQYHFLRLNKVACV